METPYYQDQFEEACAREDAEHLVQVAALFVRKDSAYKALAGVDAWDRMRNAMHWNGNCPIVAHPPCSQWGGLGLWPIASQSAKACEL